MMTYIDGQQFLNKEGVNHHSIWFKRKSMMNKIGYNGNHLGRFCILRNVEKKQQQCTMKLKRMLGRIAAPFRSFSHGQPRRNHDDKEIFVLVAIGYDERM